MGSVRALMVVEGDPSSDADPSLRPGFPIVKINAFILQGPPQTLDENVVDAAPFGAEARQEIGLWLNNRAENSDPPPPNDGNGRCSVSGACEVCRNSPPSMPRCATISTRSAASLHERLSSFTAPPLSPNGAVFARHKGLPYCPWRDWFAFVWQHPCGGWADESAGGRVPNPESASIGETLAPCR